MASVIKIKRSSVPSKVPTTSDIATGELAINTKDRKIYSSNGTVVFSFTSDYIQVANAVSTYQTKAVERAALANTNLAITNVKTGLTTTNTALRTLISDRLQVANAVATYATKANPTTSGLLAHTGRATISTNLTVSGNTVIGKLVANNSLGTAGYALKSNGSTVYWDNVDNRGIVLNNTTISANYTIPAGVNGFSVGPITVSGGYAVTVTSGQRWLVL